MRKFYLIIFVSIIFGLNCFAEPTANPASDFLYEYNFPENYTEETLKYLPPYEYDAFAIIPKGIKITKYVGKNPTVVIPESIEGYPVTIIGAEAFLGNKVIKSLFIPSTVAVIEPSAFKNCESLIEVHMSLAYEALILGAYCIYDSTTVNTGAFSGCSSLKTVSIDSGFRLEIGSGVFYNCKKLESITLPRNIYRSGYNKVGWSEDEWCFKNCSNLKTINFRGEKGHPFFSDSEYFNNAIKNGLIVNYEYIEE